MGLIMRLSCLVLPVWGAAMVAAAADAPFAPIPMHPTTWSFQKAGLSGYDAMFPLPGSA
jgi:hypothetical protein